MTTTTGKTWGDGLVYQRGNRWWIRFYDRNSHKEIREPGGDTESKAAKKLRQRIQEVRGGEFIVGADRVKVGELLDALTVHLETRGARSKSFRFHVDTMRNHFGTDRAAGITGDRLERFAREQLATVTKRGKPKRPATVNRELGVLRQAYRLAIRQRRIPPRMMPFFPMLSENGNARQGFFEDDEFEGIVSHLPSPIADVARFAFLTGWRRGEIVGLHWSNIDRAAREIRLAQTKNGDGRVLAYDDEIAALLEERWAKREVKGKNGESTLSSLVFHNGKGKPIGDFRKSWATACTAAKMPGKLFHDFRRTAARNMVRAGVAQSVAMSVTGHKTVSMFLRYKITSGDEQREALARMREHREKRATKVVELKRKKENG